MDLGQEMFGWPQLHRLPSPVLELGEIRTAVMFGQHLKWPKQPMLLLILFFARQVCDAISGR